MYYVSAHKKMTGQPQTEQRERQEKIAYFIWILSRCDNLPLEQHGHNWTTSQTKLCGCIYVYILYLICDDTYQPPANFRPT